MDKVCLKCGKTFTTQNKKAKYCSLECAYADKIKHKEKPCEVCGKLFKPQKETSRFCSQECYNSVHRSTWMDDIECLNCGISFHPKDREKKFCSLKCAYEYRTIPREEGECPICGEKFIKDPPERKYCSKKCAAQAQIKNGIIQCPTCKKEFKAKDAQTIYCSRECAHKAFSTEKYKNRLKEIALQKMGERGYMWAVQSEKMRNSYRAISKPNLEYKAFLEEQGYEVGLEFPLYCYSYDLKVGNNLIEINPAPFHNSTRHPLSRPLSKEYHYNKYKCAVDNGYKCIMVWDWMNKEDVVKLINEDFRYDGPPNLHRYNIKTKEHIVDDNYDKDDMITKGFVEIYDCGVLHYLIKQK